MGLFNKAANRLKRSGEETIRMVDYDAIPEEETEPIPLREKKPKVIREPRPKLGDLLPKRKEKSSGDDGDGLGDLDVPEDSDLESSSDTAFDLEDNEPNFYAAEQEKWDELQAKPTFEPIPDKAPRKTRKKKEEVSWDFDEQKVADVLEVLRIPATFIISSDMLIPEDFHDIDFDLQMPQGYDIGQVEFFVERSESSVKEYMKLLESRNGHIARLATTIDRLQVDLQNLKYDNQIATGIGIMPTSDNDELERENIELRLRIKKLDDEIKAKTAVPALTSKERDLYETLRDQYSMLQRENADLEEQVLTLKTRLAQIDEEKDDEPWIPDLSALDHDENHGDEFPAIELPTTLPDSPLPPSLDVSESLPVELPTEVPVVPHQPRPTESAFEVVSDDELNFDNDEDSDEAVFSSASSDDEAAQSVVEKNDNTSDDDDDELDKLMKSWGG